MNSSGVTFEPPRGTNGTISKVDEPSTSSIHKNCEKSVLNKETEITNFSQTKSDSSKVKQNVNRKGEKDRTSESAKCVPQCTSIAKVTINRNVGEHVCGQFNDVNGCIKALRHLNIRCTTLSARRRLEYDQVSLSRSESKIRDTYKTICTVARNGETSSGSNVSKSVELSGNDCSDAPTTVIEDTHSTQ